MSAVDLPTVRNSGACAIAGEFTLEYIKRRVFVSLRGVEMKLKEATLLCEQLTFCVNKKDNLGSWPFCFLAHCI